MTIQITCPVKIQIEALRIITGAVTLTQIIETQSYASNLSIADEIMKQTVFTLVKLKAS